MAAACDGVSWAKSSHRSARVGAWNQMAWSMEASWSCGRWSTPLWGARAVLTMVRSDRYVSAHDWMRESSGRSSSIRTHAMRS